MKKDCNYCENGQSSIEIKEAYGRNKLVNKEIELFLDGHSDDVDENDPILSINYENEESSGFYVDINYCPFCGRKLK